MSDGSVANRPASATVPREAGSWAKNTSAGELAPSSRSVAARSVLSAYRTSSRMPVSAVKASNSGCTSSWVRPE